MSFICDHDEGFEPGGRMVFFIAPARMTAGPVFYVDMSSVLVYFCWIKTNVAEKKKKFMRECEITKSPWC